MNNLYRALAFTVVLGSILGLSSWETSAGKNRTADGDHRVVRAYYTDRQLVDDLAAWLEPWEVHHDEGYLVVGVTQAEYDLMLAAGFRLETDVRRTSELNRPAELLPGQTSGIPGYPCYRTVEETFSTAAAIAAAHPELATWIDVGDSWEKSAAGGEDGYDMMVLRLTHSAVTGPKPKLFIMTAVHAREYATAELGTRLAEYLVESYGADPDVTWLLDYQEIHLLLQANPDGRKHAEGGAWWRKNTNENYCSPTSDMRGADLNRNFEFLWNCCEGSSSNPCSETYRGPSAASEPETETIQSYLRSQFPDQREDSLSAAAPVTATGVFIDIHSYGELVLWPWGSTSEVAPNGIALQTLGRKFAFHNSYEPAQAYELYPTDGTTDGFAYGELGLSAYTFELGTRFFQDCTAFENTILPDSLAALLYAAKASRAPYQMPAGPDVVEVTVASGGVAAGGVVRLTAIVDDTRYSNQNGTEPTQAIAAAEFYIDVPPWITTTTPISHSMAATDGAFDEPVEDVEGEIDTTGLSIGRHVILTRGQDVAGNWGALSAAFLQVLDPAVSPRVEGYVRDADTGVALEATVTAGAFRATTDPATGYYSMTVLSGTYEIAAMAEGYAGASVTGIELYNKEIVRQDLHLYSVCDFFVDEVESGNLGWTAEYPWAITGEASHSMTRSWTDSPGGEYGHNRDVSLVSSPLDLSGYAGVTLSFWHTYDLEDGHDSGYVEYSIDGGASWTQAASYSGAGQAEWVPEEIALPALEGQPNVRIGFRLSTDDWVAGEGWHVDDMVISGGGPDCAPRRAPTAEFSSNSPVIVGSLMAFSNLTSGSLPLAVRWDFGDGYGYSSETNPQYRYSSAGHLTATLAVTNTLGTSSASHRVEVGHLALYLPLVQKGIHASGE